LQINNSNSRGRGQQVLVLRATEVNTINLF
jgi:hypothetical protein